MLKNKNGITLLALVITIIVIIILAGVSISTLMGDDGIILKANKSEVAQKYAKYKEVILFNKMNDKIYQKVNNETPRLNDNIIYGENLKNRKLDIDENVIDKIGIIDNDIYYILESGDNIDQNILAKSGYIVVSREDFEYIVELKMVENIVKYINKNNIEKIGKQVGTIQYTNLVTISGSMYGSDWNILGDEDLNQVIDQLERGGEYTLNNTEKS